ncbi:hypothetical protein Pyn_21919 [Prunus yedoensis var. nudiflora]|uniref:Zinc knuckle CX2CX4HX4C domain-containing protein n=1 Tax=Prunus yedoensis var. nudiflora TaxID=2094558 RepID=A0A314YH73_PRUYE|nr:hypothetical protein Pyn_21919 [Prunus yedoensis var. nudiflora]
MNISFSGIGSKWVDFTYERLPEFCHDCGSLEHWTPDCSRPSMDIRVGVVKPSSSTLHATLEPFGGPHCLDRQIVTGQSPFLSWPDRLVKKTVVGWIFLLQWFCNQLRTTKQLVAVILIYLIQIRR